MPATIGPKKNLADEVSQETIHKVNFVTGSSTVLFGGCVFEFTGHGRTCEVIVEKDGTMKVVEKKS
jgi:hypothetical protein